MIQQDLAESQQENFSNMSKIIQTKHTEEQREKALFEKFKIQQAQEQAKKAKSGDLQRVPEAVEEPIPKSSSKDGIMRDLQKYLKIKAGLDSNSKAIAGGQDVDIMKREVDQKISEA